MYMILGRQLPLGVCSKRKIYNLYGLFIDTDKILCYPTIEKAQNLFSYLFCKQCKKKMVRIEQQKKKRRKLQKFFTSNKTEDYVIAVICGVSNDITEILAECSNESRSHVYSKKNIWIQCWKSKLYINKRNVFTNLSSKYSSAGE